MAQEFLGHSLPACPSDLSIAKTVTETCIALLDLLPVSCSLPPSLPFFHSPHPGSLRTKQASATGFGAWAARAEQVASRNTTGCLLQDEQVTVASHGGSLLFKSIITPGGGGGRL